MIDLAISWSLRHGKFFVHRSEMTLVGSCLKYLKTYTKDFAEEGYKAPKDIEDILTNISLFCIVWSIGGALEESSRKSFSQFIFEMIEGNPELITKHDLT